MYIKNGFVFSCMVKLNLKVLAQCTKRIGIFILCTSPNAYHIYDRKQADILHTKNEGFSLIKLKTKLFNPFHDNKII